MEVLSIAAASWGLVMALAPLLQVGRMLQQRSSADVSIGYLALLLPGFALWVAYGWVKGDIALVVPNAAATTTGWLTIGVAIWLRRSRPPRGRRRILDGDPDTSGVSR